MNLFAIFAKKYSFIDVIKGFCNCVKQIIEYDTFH